MNLTRTAEIRIGIELESNQPESNRESDMGHMDHYPYHYLTKDYNNGHLKQEIPIRPF